MPTYNHQVQLKKCHQPITNILGVCPVTNSSTLRVLYICFFILTTTLSCSNSGTETGDVGNVDNAQSSASSSGTDVETDDSSSSSGESNVKGVASASIVVNEVWIRNANGKGFEEQVLLGPKLVRLVPASDDNAEMLVDLMLPAGEYDQIRLVLGSGTVTLSNNVYVSDGHLFSTDLGNLKFPSGYQSGIKEKIEPPIEVVASLSQELILNFELTNSFVFNGPATHAPGVRSVLFKPVIQTINNSTHGRITLAVSGSDGAKCDADSVAGAVVTAIDTSGVNQDISTTTDQFGEAVIKLLPGVYDILIEANGFEHTTIQNNQVYIANATELGDVRLAVETGANPAVFNQDRAILLAQMAMIAYAPSDWLTGGVEDWPNLVEGDPLPYLYPGDAYVKTLKLGKDQASATEYISCWEFFKFLSKVGQGAFGLGGYSTQVFIATKVDDDAQDIVVSFRGTDDPIDFLTDIRATKGTWALRRADGTRDGVVSDAFEDDDLEITRAVHVGFRDAYAGVAFDIQEILNFLIVGDGITPGKITDTSKGHVYFTGHSLGSSLAVLAALDLADYLVEVHGYNRNNIVMYGFGVSRILTEKLRFLEDDPDTPLVEKNYQRTVPNSFSVTAHDDPVSHIPGLDADPDNLFPAEYIHNEQLVMLSTNLIDTSNERGRYKAIGKTRLEPSNGKVLSGCNTTIIPDGFPFANIFEVEIILLKYGSRGHDQVQYIKRLEDLVDTSPLPGGIRRGFPIIGGGKFDTTPNFPGGVRVRLIWDARQPPNLVESLDSVMGPCDYVQLFRGTAPARPQDFKTSDYEAVGCRAFPNKRGFQWVVNGSGYPLGQSIHETCEAPGSDAFWVGYFDGFDRLIITKQIIN